MSMKGLRIPVIMMLVVCLLVPSHGFVKAASASDMNVRYLGVKGDSTLMTLKTTEGNINIMVDAGNAKLGSGTFTIDLLNQNKASWLRSKTVNGKKMYIIDYVIITHSDKDHNGGLKDIIDSPDLMIGTLYYNNVYTNPEKPEVTQDEINMAVRNGKIEKIERMGPRFINNDDSQIKQKILTIDEGRLYNQYNCLIKIYPAIKEYYEENGKPDGSEVTKGGEKQNNSSMLIKCNYKNVNYVFAGDLYALGLKDAIKYYGSSIQTTGTTYLKLPHHGSRRAVTSGLALASSVDNKMIKVGCGRQLRMEMKLHNSTVLDEPSSGLYFQTSGNSPYYPYTYTQSRSMVNTILGRSQVAAVIDGQSYTPYNLVNINVGGVTTRKNYFVINMDEEFKKLFAKGSGQKLYGVGNIKKATNTDAESYLAIKGLDYYYDVNPGKYFTTANFPSVSGVTTPVKLLGKTLTVTNGIAVN